MAPENRTKKWSEEDLIHPPVGEGAKFNFKKTPEQKKASKTFWERKCPEKNMPPYLKEILDFGEKCRQLNVRDVIQDAIDIIRNLKEQVGTSPDIWNWVRKQLLILIPPRECRIERGKLVIEVRRANELWEKGIRGRELAEFKELWLRLCGDVAVQSQKRIEYREVIMA